VGSRAHCLWDVWWRAWQACATAGLRFRVFRSGIASVQGIHKGGVTLLAAQRSVRRPQLAWHIVVTRLVEETGTAEGRPAIATELRRDHSLYRHGDQEAQRAEGGTVCGYGSSPSRTMRTS
jgi:hypothetical protein